jgi:Ca2+-binding EF-hand superfamily protein
MKVGEDENEYRNGLKNFNNRDRQINDIHNEMKVINIVLPSLMIKYETELNQNISIQELMKKLRNFDIVYTKDKITEILNFIEINDINNFTLNEFYKKFSNSKVILNEMSHEDIYNGFRQIKDITYISGGEKFLFGNKRSISKKNFINLFLNKTKYSYEALSAIYNFLLKSERDFTISDYKKFFVDDNKIMDSEYDAIQINSFKKKIQATNLKTDEFFSHLLTYTNSRTNTKISRYDFHKICLNYKFNYSAEEIDHIFNMIDENKDGFIDRKEWNKIIKKIDKPLYQIQDVIKKNKLDIEEIMYTMEIEPTKNQRLNFNQFEEKIKKLDYTYGYEFIKELFNEMNDGNDFIDTNTIVKNFDVFHKENFKEINNNSFKRNFIQNIRMVCDYNELSNYFRMVDRYNDGRILKTDFCSIIQKFCNEFRDEDIMKFCRIMNLIDKNDINLVRYREFLTKVYYN